MTDNTLPLDDGFSRFWKLYPRHEAKKKAHQAWIKLAPDEALIDTICKAADQQATTKYAKSEKKFIPLPATWINGQRWCDEIEAASSPQPAVKSQSRSQYSDAVMLSEYSERFKAQREWVKNNWTKSSGED